MKSELWSEWKIIKKHCVISALVCLGCILSVIIVLWVVYHASGVEWRLPTLDVMCYDINLN